MNKDRLSLLENYMQSGISPLLIQNIPATVFDNAVIIKADIDRLQLNGHYENIEFCPPEWYKTLLEKSKLGPVILVIENINEIALEEQTKFVEILKYKKVSTFDLPKNCFVVATCSDLRMHKMNEEVYSLCAQI
jgi:hypothetical protein